MVDSYLSTKVGVNSASEKMRFMDGRTTDARTTAFALLTQSGRAKN